MIFFTELQNILKFWVKENNRSIKTSCMYQCNTYFVFYDNPSPQPKYRCIYNITPSLICVALYRIIWFNFDRLKSNNAPRRIWRDTDCIILNQCRCFISTTMISFNVEVTQCISKQKQKQNSRQKIQRSGHQNKCLKGTVHSSNIWAKSLANGSLIIVL